MDSSRFNSSYGQWNPPYSSHDPPAPLLPPPPPFPHPPCQSNPNSPNFYVPSQSGGHRQDYQYYSHVQDLPLTVNQQPSYYSQHPPHPQQQHTPPLPQQHSPYVPQQVSYESRRISQPSSSTIPCTDSRDISQSAWVGYKEKQPDSSGRMAPGPGRNYQYDYSRSSRDSSGVSINRCLDGSSMSRDEFRSLGYVRKESGTTRIEGNYQDRGQLKSESVRYFRDLDEGIRGLSSSVGYGSERYGVTVSRDMTRSSASHEEGARNQRWDEAHSGGRNIHRGWRENDESNQTPRKQMQKKSALLRLEAPRSYQNGRENDLSRNHIHYSGKRFNSKSFRGKEHVGHSVRGLVEKQRGRNPVDLDVSFKSNVLVAKPVSSPKRAGIRSGVSVTPGSSKARRALMADKNENTSVTEGNGKLRTHFSDEPFVSEVSRKCTRQNTASEIQKKHDKNSTPSTSDSGGKLNKVRFADADIQDRRVKITDSEEKVCSTLHAAEKISSFCEALEGAKDDINVEHDRNMEACSTEEYVIDGDKHIPKSHEDVLDSKGSGCNTGEALVPKVMEKKEIVKTPVASPTAADLSGCSEGGIHFAGKSMCSVESQPCDDEDMDCVLSPMMEVNTGFEERKSVGSSIGSLGYGENNFEKTSLDASIYFNNKNPGDQVLAKSDIGGIEDDNKGLNKNADSVSPENESSRARPEVLVSSAFLDVANAPTDLAYASNSVSGDLDNANSFTLGTYTNTMVKSPDMSIILQVEMKKLPHCENTVNPSVENVNRKEFMETIPLNSAAEMADNLDSDKGKQTCVSGTSSSNDGCLRSDETDLAMAVPSVVCMDNISTKRLVPDEDMGLGSHHPAEIPSVDQFSDSDSRGLIVCLAEPNVSLSNDITDGASVSLVERDVSQNASTLCDKLPSSSALVTEANLAIGISGMSGNETVTDAESGLHKTQPCSTACTFLPEDRFECGSSGEIGSLWDLSMDKNLKKVSSRVSSCLASVSSVSPCHISPLGAVNKQIQNKTYIQANYSDSEGGIMHKENSCADNIYEGTREEKTKPSSGTSKYRTPGTDTIAVSGDSMFPCDSLSCSPRLSFRQIQSEIHAAAMVDETSKVKEKANPSVGTCKYRTPGTNITAVSGDSMSPCESLSSSPRLYRQIRSEIHVTSMVDESRKCKEKTKPSGGTSKYRTQTDTVAISGDSLFPCDSLSSSPRLRFRQIRSEVHVAAMVDEISKVKESQKDNILLDTLQEQIVISHEVTRPGSSLADYPSLGQPSPCTDVDSYDHPVSKYHGSDLVEKPNGDPIEKLTDITSDVGSQEKYSPYSGKTLSSEGKVCGTEIPGDSGVRVSRSQSHTDDKFALTHVKDHVVSVPYQDSESKKSLSSRYEIEKRKKKSNYSTQKSHPRSMPFVPDSKKNANPPTHITKRHTWHRKSDTCPSPFVAAKSVSSALSTQQKFPKGTTESSSSYVRKGNSLLRKPSYGSPGVALLGMPPSSIQWNRLTVEDKSTGSTSMVDVDNASFLVKTGDILTLEKQSKPPSDSSTSKVSNAIATSSVKCALSYSMDHLTTGLPESIMDSATSGEANVPHTVGDTFKTFNTLSHTGYASDSQWKSNLRKVDSSNSKRMVYVKRKANQLVAASDIHGAIKSQILPSDGYFKRSKNQLVRNSESRVNQSISLPDDALDSRAAANMVSERSSSSAFSDSAVMRPFKQSKFSLVWTQNDPQPRMPIPHMRYQKILPQLVPWKRVTYWRRLMNSVSGFRNGSFPNISRKLSMTRKRHTVYTRSTNGYALRKSKVLSIGGSHLKWSKSIERDSRKANEEATLAVAAFTKKENEKHSGQSNTSTTSRNQLARERVFRFGSLRYKMDSSRRTLQRISDVDSPCSGPSETGKGAKRPFIPKRLVIGNEEYVRVGNGNQLVRDPKKRTRALANEKVRWSLHNVRLRLAKKKKYCQFFTRFGECNKDDGKCPYVHDSSKIAVCTKFLNGLCDNANCKLTHKVIPERMPDCSYFLQGLCNNETCPYRHVHVNPSAPICDGFLKGYCSDGDECQKKHSYTCPVFEATGSCSQGSKCKLHHPKNQSKERKRKRPSEPSQKNARGRYFGSFNIGLSESEPMVVDRRSTDSEVFGMEGLDFISLGASEYGAGDKDDPATEQSISSDSEAPVSTYNLIRPVALMQ